MSALQDFFLNHNIVPLWEVMLRVFLACLIGFILGMERYQKDKPMGYRTFMIVAVITTLLALMGQFLYEDYQTAEEVLAIDLGKIISGVLTGIGFLGAGAIMQDKGEQKLVGTATGASIWAAGCMGLMLGFGQYVLVITGFILTYMALAFLKKVVK